MKKLSLLLSLIMLSPIANLLQLNSALAFQQTSTNYSLEGEFGIFGGAKSSANYGLTDTGGGFAVGFGSSANYGTGSGFQYVIAEVRELVFIISDPIVDLGALSTTPKGVPSTITVSTNGAGGYQVTVIEDGNLRTTVGDEINDVSGGTVDTSTEEYGLGTSKAGQYFAQDTDCPNTPFNATARLIASSSLPITNDSTTICYSAAIAGDTPAGQYSHVLTYIATGTF